MAEFFIYLGAGLVIYTLIGIAAALFASYLGRVGFGKWATDTEPNSTYTPETAAVTVLLWPVYLVAVVIVTATKLVTTVPEWAGGSVDVLFSWLANLMNKIEGGK